MGLSPQNAALVERIFGKPVMLDEEGEDWNALLDAARSEATEAQARRIGELEAAARRYLAAGDAYTATGAVAGDDVAAMLEFGQAEEALRALLPTDIKEPSDDR